MATESSPRQTTKADSVSFKGLWPVLLFGTAVVVVVGLIGRKATEK